MVVDGDFNAKFTLWDFNNTDAKDENLGAFASSFRLWTVNSGNRLTFQRKTSMSVINVTFAGSSPYEVT